MMIVNPLLDFEFGGAMTNPKALTHKHFMKPVKYGQGKETRKADPIMVPPACPAIDCSVLEAKLITQCLSREEKSYYLASSYHVPSAVLDRSLSLSSPSLCLPATHTLTHMADIANLYTLS